MAFWKSCGEYQGLLRTWFLLVSCSGALLQLLNVSTCFLQSSVYVLPESGALGCFPLIYPQCILGTPMLVNFKQNKKTPSLLLSTGIRNRKSV